MEKTPHKYFPQLDAIRGFFFLLVFLYHAWHPVFTAGHFANIFHAFYEKIYLSMDVFFVLSSFLLTWLGINEYKKTGSFSIRKYFMRRVLRIWPLYYSIMLFAFVLLPFLSQRMGVGVTLPPASWYLLFISNFYEGEHVYFLRFLWSLSVEEQFYLLLGTCLFLFQKHLRIVFGLIMLAGIVFNLWAIFTQHAFYFHTLTYFFDFAAGAFLAWLIAYSSRFRSFFEQFTRTHSFLLYASFILIAALTFIGHSQMQKGLSLDIAELIIRFGFIVFITLILAEQVLNVSTILPIGKNRFLAYTGKISYGLYCFHGIVLTFGTILLERIHVQTSLFTILGLFAVNYMISFLSFKYLEKPFLQLKERFISKPSVH